MLLLFVIVICLIVLLIFQKIRFSKKIKAVRNDAVKRSKAVLNGQLTEQLAPYLPEFPCAPADARFIGKPVDYVAFSGLAEKGSVDEILLIEVKTGGSQLNSHEKEIKNAVKDGRVRYVEYRIN